MPAPTRIFFRCLLPLASTLLLTSCQGDFGDGLNQPPAPPPISGTVSGQVPSDLLGKSFDGSSSLVYGFVQLKDAKGRTVSQEGGYGGVLNNKGQFNLRVPVSMKPPYILQATGYDAAGKVIQYYSVYTRAMERDVDVKVNVTPLTTLITSRVIGAPVYLAWNTPGAYPALGDIGTFAQLEQTAKEAKTALKPLLNTAGIDGAAYEQLNLQTDGFDLNHQGMDAVFDVLRIKLNSAQSLYAAYNLHKPNERLVVDLKKPLNETAISGVINKTLIGSSFFGFFNTMNALHKDKYPSSEELLTVVADNYLNNSIDSPTFRNADYLGGCNLKNASYSLASIEKVENREGESTPRYEVLVNQRRYEYPVKDATATKKEPDCSKGPLLDEKGNFTFATAQQRTTLQQTAQGWRLVGNGRKLPLALTDQGSAITTVAVINAIGRANFDANGTDPEKPTRYETGLLLTFPVDGEAITKRENYGSNLRSQLKEVRLQLLGEDGKVVGGFPTRSFKTSSNANCRYTFLTNSADLNNCEPIIPLNSADIANIAKAYPSDSAEFGARFQLTYHKVDGSELIPGEKITLEIANLPYKSPADPSKPDQALADELKPAYFALLPREIGDGSSGLASNPTLAGRSTPTPAFKGLKDWVGGQDFIINWKAPFASRDNPRTSYFAELLLGYCSSGQYKTSRQGGSMATTSSSVNVMPMNSLYTLTDSQGKPILDAAGQPKKAWPIEETTQVKLRQLSLSTTDEYGRVFISRYSSPAEGIDATTVCN